MKRILSILFLLSALLFSIDASALSIAARYAWKGKLGTNITFSLELERNINDLVIGETTYYRRNGTIRKLPVYGEYFIDDEGNESMFLNEYDGTKICGTFLLELKGNHIKEGQWRLGEKELGMTGMMSIDFSLPKTKSRFVPATASNIAGEFSFSYNVDDSYLPERGGSAEISISGNTLDWHMCQVTPNIAESEGNTTFTGNTFTDQTGKTRFRAWVYDKLLYVKRLNPEDGMDENFGMGASIEGIYIRCK